MSQLKFELKKNDYVTLKKNPTDLHFVIKIDTHRVFLRRESDDKLLDIPKRMINMDYVRVEPKVIEVLYEKANSIAKSANTNSDSNS